MLMFPLELRLILRFTVVTRKARVLHWFSEWFLGQDISLSYVVCLDGAETGLYAYDHKKGTE